MISAIKKFWHDHVQKTFGWIISSLGVMDAATYIAGIQHDITTLVGAKVYAITHIAVPAVLGALVAIRGHQATSQQNAILPPPVKSDGTNH